MEKRIFNLKSQENKRRLLRQKTTSSELLFWQKIRNKQLGYKFRRQHGIGKYIVDFYCSEKKIVVEIDGGIHFCSQNIKSDRAREDYFKKLGLKIKRYTNLDILRNIENVLADLSDFLKNN